MRQATLKLKMSIRENVNVTNNNIDVQKTILNLMLCILAALALWYVLILANTVFSIIERKTLEKEALALENQVGSLELSYLAVSNSVDLSLSSAMGFKETKATFATRKSLGSLKINNNEI